MDTKTLIKYFKDKVLESYKNGIETDKKDQGNKGTYRPKKKWASFEVKD